MNTHIDSIIIERKKGVSKAKLVNFFFFIENPKILNTYDYFQPCECHPGRTYIYTINFIFLIVSNIVKCKI